MKKQLAEALKDAGSAHILACRQLNSFVLEVTRRYGCTEQQAINLALFYRCSNKKSIDNILEV